MSRRVTAAVGAAALLAVALPAMPAFASAASTATLLAEDTEVVPGGTNVFDITVRNSETSGLLGSGRTVNAIRVLLPAEIGIKTVTALPTVDGWTVKRTSSNGLERYDLFATGAGLAPGASLALPLPAEVLRPSLGDRASSFQVAVSSDGGNTYQTSTGTLGTTIRTLQVRSVTVVDDTVNGVRQSVADGTATAGQRILTRVTVENLAASAQDVTAKLASAGGVTPADSVGSADPLSVPGFAGGPGSTTFTIPVTLGSVTSDTTRTFTGSATSSRSSATTPRFTAALSNYIVQAAPTLTLSGFAPAAGNATSNVDFTVSANKVGSPGLTIPTTSTLVLRSRADGTKTSAPINLKDPVTFGPSTNAKPLTYVSTLLPRTLLDGRYDALFSFSGTDDNGAPLLPAQSTKTLADVFNFDNALPVVNVNITLPTDLDGDRTTAARNYKLADGNAISVTATGSDTGGVPDLREVVLTCEAGASTVFSPTGTPSSSTSGTTRTVTARFEVADFGGCTSFEAKATFLDAAKNVGEETTATISVDNQVPTLDSEKGVTGAVGRFDGVDANKASIMVAIEDNLLSTDTATTGAIGGCDPRAYRVDGQLLVQGVYVLENGQFRECTIGLAGMRAAAKPANNARYLRLTSDISRGGTTPQPQITYTAASGIGSDRVKDAAGNYAGNAVQDTVNRLKPLAPALVDVTRAAGQEDAFFDGTSYFTRFVGNDLKVTVAGGLDGDVIQLLDAAGNQIGDTVSVSGGGGTVAVPVAAIEGSVQRFGIRFISPAPVDGDVTPLSVVFDKTVPKALSTTRGSGNTATVTFAEPVVGSNGAVNWNVFENVQDEAGQPVKAFRGVSSVAGTGTVRTLTADFTSNPYGGALYEYLNGLQYEDYAGNDLASTVLVNAG